MDPQCDDYWLPMYRIAELYDLCGIDRGRVRRWLTNAYWRGELEAYARPSALYRMMTCREMLAVWRDYDHPEILFLLNDIPMERRDDELIREPLCPSIVLPERTEEWTDQHCEPDYRVPGPCRSQRRRAGL